MCGASGEKERLFRPEFADCVLVQAPVLFQNAGLEALKYERVRKRIFKRKQPNFV